MLEIQSTSLIKSRISYGSVKNKATNADHCKSFLLSDYLGLTYLFISKCLYGLLSSEHRCRAKAQDN